MDPRFLKRNRRGQSEASSSLARNDPFFQRFVPFLPRGASNAELTGAQSKRNQHSTRWYDYKDGRQSKGNYQQLSRSNSVSSESSTVRLGSDSGKLNSYVCPKCKHPYNYMVSNNALTGRVPRVLPCVHTVCEECINKSIKNTNHMQCPICSQSGLDRKQICIYNHYILGQITQSRFNRNKADISNIALTSADTKSLTNTEPVLKAKCGFQNCLNPGAISCQDCCGVYCKSCDDALHKSGKQLMSHKRAPLKATFELQKCPDHSMYEDIICSDCKETCCCYCILEKHEGHPRIYLGRLNNTEEEELLQAYEKAKSIKKQLTISQKKISGTEKADMVSDLEVEITQRFADIHAQLYFLEKKLLDEAKLFKKSCNLALLNESIESDIETIDKMINSVEERKNVKLNMRMLLSKLKEMESLPTVLVTDESSEKSRLVVDEEIDHLDKYFKLEIPKEVKFKLVQMDKLPQDYLEEMKLEQEEPKLNTSLESENNSNSRSRPRYESKDDTLRQHVVFVTHINSLDSFYVQLKEDDNKFKQLEQEIANHVPRMQIGVSEVLMKELYMAKRLSGNNKWSRVRVLEKYQVDEGERYKVKFIDFGNVASLEKKDLMYISSSLAKKKPFAFECKLDNPSEFEWPKDTHLELAKLLDANKELIMYTKDISNHISTVVLHVTTSIGGSCSVTDLLIFGCDALRKESKNPTPVQESKALVNKLFDNSDVFITGNSYEVFIRYVFDPSHIFVQKTCYEDCFNNMIKQMEGYYCKSTCNIHIPIKNSYVVVRHQTKNFGNWHRAKILEVNEQKKTVDVYLVDIGKRLDVSWRDIRKLFELFRKSECLVVCAKLADVAPCWNNVDEVREYLERYLKRTLRMKMLVTNNEPLEMVLFEPYQNYDVNINAVLVENNLVSSTGKYTDTKMWLHTEEDKKEDHNVLFIKDDSEDEDSDTVEGLIQQVEMVRFENPFSFYVSFFSKKAEADKLHEELQIHYKSKKYFREERNWQVDDKVVVYDKMDNTYYRGILRVIDGDKYCVNLLDKPDYLWVDSEKLRIILPYFADNFPNSVIKCHMANIKPAGDSSKWSHLSLEWFEMLFKKHGDIFLKKIGTDETKSSMPVTMWYSKLIQGTALEPSYRKYISIDKKVVTAGLAFWINNEVSPSFENNKPSANNQIAKTNNVKDDELSQNEAESKETAPAPIIREIKSLSRTEWLPPLDFNSKEFFGYITCAENEGHLFVREEKMQKCYKDLERNMREYFDITPNPPFTLRENQMVTVRSGGLWYRSTVLKVIDRTTALILMVDFGSDHIVKMEDLHDKIMYPEIPILVSKIKLYDLKCKNKTWTDSEVNTLIATAPQYAKIVIRRSLCESAPLADVYDVDGVCLNDKLVELCPNLYRPIQSYIKNNTVLDQNPENHCEQLEKEQIDDMIVQEKNNCAEVLDEEFIDNIEEEELVVEGAFKRYKYAEFTDEVSEMDIICVYDYKTISLYHPDEKSEEKEFEALTKTMRDNVDSLEPLKNFEIGQPCLSLFEEDNQWYRAKLTVVDAQQCGYVTVIYVDYGNFEVVKLTDLKTIKPEWLDFPARYADAVIDYKLMKKDQENVLSKHIQSLAGKRKYIGTTSTDPLLVHVYNMNNTKLEYFYDVFVENSIVEI